MLTIIINVFCFVGHPILNVTIVTFVSLGFSWFYGNIDHSTAVELLLQPENPNGSFLIRTSKKHDLLKLALKDTNTVSHYWIWQHKDSSYYISSWTKFCTIQELIDHHKKDADGIVRQLSDPCICTDHPVTPAQSYKDKWETDQNTLQFDKELGKGNFTEVWSGVWNSVTPRPVAIKTLKSRTIEVADFLVEAQIMKKLHHPNLLQLYAVCTLEEPVIIITELMKHGALSDYLQKGNGRNLISRQLINMAVQIVEGMAYLEEHSYMHRDLAARSILVNDKNVDLQGSKFWFSTGNQGELL